MTREKVSVCVLFFCSNRSCPVDDSTEGNIFRKKKSQIISEGGVTEPENKIMLRIS